MYFISLLRKGKVRWKVIIAERRGKRRRKRKRKGKRRRRRRRRRQEQEARLGE
jgi:hypothetical protein